MNKSGTRLSLTSLDDRIVPSATLTDPGKSGIVNAIYVEVSGVGGVTTGPCRPSDGDSSVVLMDASSLDPLGTGVNGRRTSPQPLQPAPTPQFVDANGVPAPKRGVSNAEELQILQLTRLGLVNLYQISVLQKMHRSAELERIGLESNAVQDAAALQENAELMNSLADRIYMLQRKNVELLHAIDSIRQAADNGYPADTVVAPPHVFNPNRIGTAEGGSTWIQAVLNEK